MTLENLQNARTTALKNQDHFTKEVINSMIDACQKASITTKGRVEITESLVNEVLIKYQKTIQEMIDTCPQSRPDLMDKYCAEMAIVKIYAPQLMTDPNEIEQIIKERLSAEGIELIKANKGKVMKTLASLKGTVDMKIVNQIVTSILN